MEFRTIISGLVILLTFAGYLPYIIDIFKGKTKPHAVTWFLVTLTAGIAYALQVEGGAGVGAYPMLGVSIICGFVFLLSLWRGTRDIKRIDIWMLIISLVTLGLWLFIDQPILSILLITLSEVVSYIPTIRKSWGQPYSETLSLYQISAFRHSLAIVALEKINLLTALYPATWALTNLTIALILISRRKGVPPS